MPTPPKFADRHPHDTAPGEDHPLDALFRPASVGPLPTSKATTCPELVVIEEDANGLARALDQAVTRGAAAVVLRSGTHTSKAGDTPADKTLEAALTRAEAAHVPVLGPNSYGLCVPGSRVYAMPEIDAIQPGRVAFIAQGSACCAEFIAWAKRAEAGFRALVDVGDEHDVGCADAIQYFGADNGTAAVVVAVEALRDSRAFLATARECAAHKPLYAFRSAAPNPIQDAVLDRAGIVIVDDLETLVYTCASADMQPQPGGPRLAVFTNDTGRTGTDLFAADWSDDATSATMTLDAAIDPQQLARALAERLSGFDCNGALVALTGAIDENATGWAESIANAAARRRKPVLVVWDAMPPDTAANRMLRAARIPVMPTRATAVAAFRTAAAYVETAKTLYETPHLLPHEYDAPADGFALEALARRARRGACARLAAAEVKAVFKAYGLPSPDCETPRARGAQLRLSGWIDEAVGPVLHACRAETPSGGAVALPPLTETLARHWLVRAGIELGASDGDDARLFALLVGFARLVVDQDWIARVTVDSLSVDRAAIAIGGATITPWTEAMGERPRPAIRPYPTELIQQHVMRDGARITIRPVRPEDEEGIAAFHATLSDETVHRRYLGMVSLLSRIGHDRLSRICMIDYDRAMVLVAEAPAEENGAGEILAVGRFHRMRNPRVAEFGLTVSDKYQGHGLGGHILRALIDAGRKEGLDALLGFILPSNRRMLELCAGLGFAISFPEHETALARYDYDRPRTPE